jgi:large subunit ribosomal protein L34
MEGVIERAIIGDFILDNSLTKLAIKRTYQPHKIRRRRKFGFLKRLKTVGGRKVISRRKKAGRKRLAG